MDITAGGSSVGISRKQSRLGAQSHLSVFWSPRQSLPQITHADGITNPPHTVMDADSRKEAILAAVNDDSRSQAILVVTTVFLALSLVSVGLRCFVRTRVVRAFGWDDKLMLIAMVSDARQPAKDDH